MIKSFYKINLWIKPYSTTGWVIKLPTYLTQPNKEHRTTANILQMPQFIQQPAFHMLKFLSCPKDSTKKSIYLHKTTPNLKGLLRHPHELIKRNWKLPTLSPFPVSIWGLIDQERQRDFKTMV